MAYTVKYNPEVLEELGRLRAYDRAKVLDHIQQFLATNPTAVGPVRIKQLTDVSPPLFRLRVDEMRVVYDVKQETQTVVIRAVVRKTAFDEWLAEYKKRVKPDEDVNAN